LTQLQRVRGVFILFFPSRRNYVYCRIAIQELRSRPRQDSCGLPRRRLSFCWERQANWCASFQACTSSISVYRWLYTISERIVFSDSWFCDEQSTNKVSWYVCPVYALDMLSPSVNTPTTFIQYSQLTAVSTLGVIFAQSEYIIIHSDKISWNNWYKVTQGH